MRIDTENLTTNKKRVMMMTDTSDDVIAAVVVEGPRTRYGVKMGATVRLDSNRSVMDPAYAAGLGVLLAEAAKIAQAMMAPAIPA